MPSMTEFDIVFLSYDEPNAEKHWADLLGQASWAKRVHKVKGFDAAHRACAAEAETEWLITVDADNIVRPEFFDLEISDDDLRNANCLSWNALNAINGLSYGNGGLKLWRKSFLEKMACHELAENPENAIDFCWEAGYRNMLRTYSDVYNNASAYQAFRVGFREGVKLSVDRGERVTGEMMRHILHPLNLRNLTIWSSVGAHMDNGLWAMYGTRLGWQSMLNTDWDYSVVKDFDWFNEYWTEIQTKVLETSLEKECEVVGEEIEAKTKICIPVLPASHSRFFKESFTLRNE